MNAIVPLSPQGLNLHTPGLGSAQSAAAERAGHGTAIAPLADMGQAPPLVRTETVPLPSRATTALQARDPQFNQRVGAAQQTLAWLDTLTTRLDKLKTDLSAQLAGPAVQRPLAQDIAQVQALWQQRQAATLGRLDTQLRFTPDAEAHQRFQVQGLDQRSLQSGARETLAFTTGAAGPVDQRVRTAVIDPAYDETAVRRVLDHALAPAGMRVTQAADGQVLLSTPESQWPAVRDGLSVKGGGIRFPGQQFHRVRTEPEAPAMQPQAWKADTPAEQRQTLQQVLPALAQVRHARQTVQSSLDQAGQALAIAPSSGDAAWARQFAGDFAASAEQPGYAMFAALAPALQGVSRQRAEAVLGPATSA